MDQHKRDSNNQLITFSAVFVYYKGATGSATDLIIRDSIKRRSLNSSLFFFSGFVDFRLPSFSLVSVLLLSLENDAFLPRTQKKPFDQLRNINFEKNTYFWIVLK